MNDLSSVAEDGDLSPGAEGGRFRLPWRATLALTYPRGVIPLGEIAVDFLGMSARRAAEKAGAGALDLPAFRLGTQKSVWCVRVDDFADLIESRSAEARKRWEAVTDGRAAA